MRDELLHTYQTETPGGGDDCPEGASYTIVPLHVSDYYNTNSPPHSQSNNLGVVDVMQYFDTSPYFVPVSATPEP